MKTCTLLLIIVAGCLVMRVNHPRRQIAPPPSDGYQEQAPSICIAYPHALVRCGVASSEEFEAHRNDASLREHYSEVGMVQPALLTADEWDYASFRGATGIVWTPVRILVRAGEYVLRDRVGNTIRARCGNRLSPTPRKPVAFTMPPEMELETPGISISEPPVLVGWPGKLENFLVPALPTLVETAGTSVEDPPLKGWPTAPDIPLIAALPVAIPPVIGFPPQITIPPHAPPINGVPEPQSGILILSAVLAVLIVAARRANSTP